MAYVPSMGFAFSSGSGVVKATGLSNSNPFHRLVGVAVFAGNGFSVAGGVACTVLAHETIKNILMIAMTGNATGSGFCDSMVAPLTDNIKESIHEIRKETGTSLCEGSFLQNNTGINDYDGVILA